MIELSNCPLCNSQSISVAKEYTYLKPESNDYHSCKSYTERRLWILFNHVCSGQEQLSFQLTHCQSCDLLFTNPRFEDDEIARKYELLVELSSTVKEYGSKPLANLDKRAKRIAELVNRHISIMEQERLGRVEIADVGGQFGHNLKYFKSDVFRKHVVDYEKYDLYQDIEYLRPNWEDISTEFDAIITNHTVEHLSFPTSYLAQLVSHLKDGGILYIEVPLGAFREAHNIREPLTHFNFYSEYSLYLQFKSIGLVPKMVESRYQWVTNHAEWCINAIGLKSSDEICLDQPKLNRSEMKGRWKYYLPLIMKRVLNSPEFGAW